MGVIQTRVAACADDDKTTEMLLHEIPGEIPGAFKLLATTSQHIPP